MTSFVAAVPLGFWDLGVVKPVDGIITEERMGPMGDGFRCPDDEAPPPNKWMDVTDLRNSSPLRSSIYYVCPSSKNANDIGRKYQCWGSSPAVSGLARTPRPFTEFIFDFFGSSPPCSLLQLSPLDQHGGQRRVLRTARRAHGRALGDHAGADQAQRGQRLLLALLPGHVAKLVGGRAGHVVPAVHLAATARLTHELVRVARVTRACKCKH